MKYIDAVTLMFAGMETAAPVAGQSGTAKAAMLLVELVETDTANEWVPWDGWVMLVAKPVMPLGTTWSPPRDTGVLTHPSVVLVSKFQAEHPPQEKA